MTPEGNFKKKLTSDVKNLFPGVIIIWADVQQTQGKPDMILLHGDRWAALEVKAASKSARRPNQPHWVEKMNGMSYAAFICPENKGEVLDGLQQALRPRGQTRLP